MRPEPPIPPDDAGLAPELRFLRALWELDHALESASRRMKRTFGVTGRERLFLRFVGQRPGIVPGELAELLHVHPSGVTALLKRLERRRLVTRRPSPGDARRVPLALTAAGERIDALRSGTIEAAVRDALAAAAPRDVAVTAAVLGGVARRLFGAPGRAGAARPKRASARPRAPRR